MYLYTRRARLAPGHGTAGVDWALTVARKARELTGQELRLWGAVWSPGVGTITWTAWVDGLEALEKIGDILEGDAAMEKLTSAGTRYIVGGYDDGLLEPVVGEPPTDRVQYVAATAAVASRRGATQAIAAGADLARRAEAVTGRPTLFGRAVTGRGGEVQWLTGFERAEDLDAAQRSLARDDDWLALLDATRRRFAPAAAGGTTIYRRLG
jgi:hypothetical protein